MTSEERAQLDKVMREGLTKLGVPSAEIDAILDPANPPEVAKQRFQAAMDARLQARLGEMGMTQAEQAAVLDSSGTEEEQRARRERALAEYTAREIANDPRLLDQIVDKAVGDLEKAFPQARRKPWLPRIAAICVVLAIGGLGAFLFLRPSACRALVSGSLAALGPDVKAVHELTSKYSCSIDVEDAQRKTVLSARIERASAYEGWREDLARYASVEPLSIGADRAELAIAPSEQAAPPPSIEDLQAMARRGVRDPMGAALRAMPPSSHLILVKAGQGALRVSVTGSPDQARRVANELVRPAIEHVRNASYR